MAGHRGSLHNYQVPPPAVLHIARTVAMERGGKATVPCTSSIAVSHQDAGSSDHHFALRNVAYESEADISNYLHNVRIRVEGGLTLGGIQLIRHSAKYGSPRKFGTILCTRLIYNFS